MPWPSTGEKLPLVSAPTTSPSTSTAHSARGGRRPSVAMPDEQTGGAGVALGSRAALPRNTGLLRPTTQPRPACSGVIPGPSSWPWSGSPASSRNVSRAPSPAGRTPAARSRPQLAARQRARPSRRPSPCVARAGDRQPMPFHGIWATLNRRRPWPRVTRGRTAPAGRAPGRRGWLGWVVSTPPMASLTRSVFDVFGMTSNTHRFRDLPPHDDVVEDGALVLVAEVRVLRSARGRSLPGRS